MPAGNYYHRAEIQRRSKTEDAGGNAVYTWGTVSQRWASLEDTGGKELYRAQKVDATVDAVVILREQYDGLAPEDRVVIDGRTLEVKAVLGQSDRTAKRGQILRCREVV